MIRIGILSDTHLNHCSDLFRAQVETAFAGCSIILHAGDLTNIAVLEAFSTKELHAVHGNMCDHSSQQQLPQSRLLTIGGYHIGLFHGAWGPRHTIEERAWAMFPQADCIVYGHTHHAVCHWLHDVLFINPGTFQGTGRFGAPGTYAILTIDEELKPADRRHALHGAIHVLQPQP